MILELIWIPTLTIGLGLIALFKASDNALNAAYLYLNREMTATDSWIASLVKGMKERGERPPPYALYAACWLCVGTASFAVGVQLWQ
jgi:hypothetical protein